MRKLFAGSIVVLLLLLVVLVLPAQALHDVFVIPVDTIVRGPVGSVHVLADEDVDPEFQGLTCDVDIEVDNQDSAHPDSDIRIVSGTTLLFADVENPAYNVFIGSGQIVLANYLAITLTLGGDGVWSAGLELTVTCPETPTTTTTITTTTTVPDLSTTTIPPSTSTTQPLSTTVPSTLPYTGISSVTLGGAGLAMILLGSLIWLSVRFREE